MILLLLSFAMPALAQNHAFVQGQVLDETDRPVAYVNVQITGTLDGAITNRDGRFAFSTQHMGKYKLHASFIGYESAQQTLYLTPGDTTTVRLILRLALIELDETTVTASTYTTGEDETVTLSPSGRRNNTRRFRQIYSAHSKPSPASRPSMTAPASLCAEAT